MESPSGSVALPFRVTVAPSAISWSGPAFTDGAVLALSVTVIMTLSETVAVPSDTVRVNSTGVSESTWGAVNVADGEAALASAMSRAESCVHR